MSLSLPYSTRFNLARDIGPRSRIGDEFDRGSDRRGLTLQAARQVRLVDLVACQSGGLICGPCVKGSWIGITGPRILPIVVGIDLAWRGGSGPAPEFTGRVGFVSVRQAKPG